MFIIYVCKQINSVLFIFTHNKIISLENKIHNNILILYIILVWYYILTYEFVYYKSTTKIIVGNEYYFFNKCHLIKNNEIKHVIWFMNEKKLF